MQRQMNKMGKTWGELQAIAKDGKLGVSCFRVKLPIKGYKDEEQCFSNYLLGFLCIT